MRLAFALLALLASPVAAQTPDCANPIYQVEINACAEQDWLAADADLNAAYKAARAAMRALDADFAPAERGAEAALRDGQRAWIAFRDGTCAAEGWIMRGGSAEPMLIYGCRARLTRVRAADLWSMQAY